MPGMSLDRWHVIDLAQITDQHSLLDIFPPAKFPQVAAITGDPLMGFPGHEANPPAKGDSADKARQIVYALTWPGFEEDPVSIQENIKMHLPPPPTRPACVVQEHRDWAASFHQVHPWQVSYEDILEMYKKPWPTASSASSSKDHADASTRNIALHTGASSNGPSSVGASSVKRPFAQDACQPATKQRAT